MAFPFTPLDTTVEIYYSGAWHEIESSVYARNDIEITRGTADQGTSADTSKLSMTINNRDGTFSPRNPRSPLFGLIGRNTPIRVAVSGYDFLSDGFNRVSTVNGWGFSEYEGTTWTVAGSGGSVLLTDWQVNGSQGTMLVSATNAIRLAIMDVDIEDVSVTTEVTFNHGSVTGAGVESGCIMLRGQSLSAYYLCLPVLNTDGSVTAAIYSIGGTGALGTATVAGLTHTGQKLKVRAETSVHTIRMKVWDAALAEPAAWAVSVTNAEITGAGFVGLYSGVLTGNTNVTPTFTYDNMTMTRSTRFSGNVNTWPQAWTSGGKDVWVSLEASGIGRRIAPPGGTPKSFAPMDVIYSRSAELFDLPQPFVWWPMDTTDGRLVTSMPSGFTGGAPLVVEVASTGATINTGTIQGSATGPVGSKAALDVSKGGQLRCTNMTVVSNATTDPLTLELSVIFNEPLDPATQTGELIRLKTYATDKSTTFTLFAGPTPGAETTVTGASIGLVPGSDTVIGTDVRIDDGQWHHLSLTFQPIGADTAVLYIVDGAQVILDTLTGVGFGSLGEIVYNGSGDIDAMCHAAIYRGTMTGGYTVGYTAFVGCTGAGETAGNRLRRLAEQEGFEVSIRGNEGTTTLMGAQTYGTLMEKLQECVDADQGLFSEARDFPGWVYTTREQLYNQTATYTAGYSNDAELALPLAPTEDDDALANDVTVSRGDSGALVRLTQDTGSLGTQDPPTGVGRYGTGPVELVLTSDRDSLQACAWLLHHGTWNEARYTAITIDAANLARVGKTSLIANMGSLDVGNVVAITSPPAWLPGETIAQVVRGFSETLNAFKWTVSLNAGPAYSYEVWAVESTSSNRGRVASGPSRTLVNEVLDTTETGVDILSALVPWINSAAYAAMFPFSVMINGEQMTVTALTGTTITTQSMTVVRSVNGVVRTHAVGSEVQLLHPPAIAR